VTEPTIQDVIAEIRASAGSDPSFDTNRELKKKWADQLESLTRDRSVSARAKVVAHTLRADERWLLSGGRLDRDGLVSVATYMREAANLLDPPIEEPSR
jgi:hypothetical protein